MHTQSVFRILRANFVTTYVIWRILALPSPRNMSTGHPNQACARCPILARLGPSTPQNDRTNGGINLLY